MLKRVGKYLGYALLWCVIVVVIVWADRLSDRHNDQTTVLGTEMSIRGGGDNPLIDESSVEGWLTTYNLAPEGSILSKTDIAAIERSIESHSAVEQANVYACYDGSVRIEITQREPIARLRLSGYDMYITDDGYLLPATDCYSVRVPVITGGYVPLFSPQYMGYAKDMVRDTIASLDRRVEELEESKLPHLEELRANKIRLREITSQHVKRGLFTSEIEYEVISSALKQRKTEARAYHNGIERQIKGRIADIDAEIAATRHKQKEVRCVEQDFDQLLSLLLTIRESTFWSAEVVQLIASGGGNKPLQLAIVPRSGRFTVDLGTVENLDQKLHNLRLFYDKGLDNIGWNRYKHISLRYEGQVVCR